MSDTDAFPQRDNWAAEVAALDAVLAAIAPQDWDKVSKFKGWRVRDHVHHLAMSDIVAAQAITDPEDFREHRRERAQQALSAADAGTPQALLQRWRDGVAGLRAAVAGVDPGARFPWFGPDMSARAFLSARQMETWAHGQTIHDTLDLNREATDRLKEVCELGWRTRGWSYKVRERELPGAPLLLRLTAPSGQVWTWGDAAAENRVEGAAEDFALVVCQCRNVADTGLRTTGPVAAEWMSIAQCFAGAANDPPPPGVRARATR
jgi:uncharacterized protein (TIGR03084 family)